MSCNVGVIIINKMKKEIMALMKGSRPNSFSSDSSLDGGYFLKEVREHAIQGHTGDADLKNQRFYKALDLLILNRTIRSCDVLTGSIDADTVAVLHLMPNDMGTSVTPSAVGTMVTSMGVSPVKEDRVIREPTLQENFPFKRDFVNAARRFFNGEGKLSILEPSRCEVSVRCGGCAAVFTAKLSVAKSDSKSTKVAKAGWNVIVSNSQHLNCTCGVAKLNLSDLVCGV
jgi:hypothetical protein